MGFIRQVFDPNDTSVELHDLAGLAVIGVMVSAAGAAIYRGTALDFQSFGTGVSAVIVAMTGGGWMKGRQRAVDRDCDIKRKS